jgi:Family of unknown function (DUF6286)
MRAFNRVLGLLLGLALAAAGAIAVVEIVLGLTGQPPWLIARSDWDTGLSRLVWTSPTLITVLVGLTLVGLILLVLQLVPRAPVALPLRPTGANRSAEIDRRGLQERLRQVASADPDVLGARVRARRRRVKVAVNVPPDADAADVRNRLRGDLDESLGELGLAVPYRSVVAVRRARERVR